MFPHFYPRPPRGGRPKDKYKLIQLIHFYPRPPRGGRRLLERLEDGPADISIHALREEGDELNKKLSQYIDKFLSTPSARRATNTKRQHTTTRYISIHALREEGDIMALVVIITI